uniref:AraC family transcriptional regulator n=1 Tax=Heterorhabditis bacteriophora TaxID=37862 RepID=A0A1I7X6I2_HETBA
MISNINAGQLETAELLFPNALTTPHKISERMRHRDYSALTLTHQKVNIGSSVTFIL